MIEVEGMLPQSGRIHEEFSMLLCCSFTASSKTGMHLHGQRSSGQGIYVIFDGFTPLMAAPTNDLLLRFGIVSHIVRDNKRQARRQGSHIAVKKCDEPNSA